MAQELTERGLLYERERPLPIAYRGVMLECGYRLDFVVRNELILEIKSVETLLPLHAAQLLTYLKLTGIRAGLLVNFNAVPLRRGLRRLTLEK